MHYHCLMQRVWRDWQREGKTELCERTVTSIDCLYADDRQLGQRQASGHQCYWCNEDEQRHTTGSGVAEMTFTWLGRTKTP